MGNWIEANSYRGDLKASWKILFLSPKGSFAMSKKWAIIIEVDLEEGVGVLARGEAGAGEVVLLDSKEEAEEWVSSSGEIDARRWDINYIKFDILTKRIPWRGKVRVLNAKQIFQTYCSVSSSNPQAIRPVLENLITKGSMTENEEEFLVNAKMKGESAKELNSFLLSSLRTLIPSAGCLMRV
jgi:hypothetical protein